MKTSTAVTVTAATLLSAGVAYALYFDYRRRNDAAFRKSLRKQSKKASKSAGSSASSSAGAAAGGSIPRTPAERAAALDRAYAEIKRADKEEMPKDMGALRLYFDRQVSLGETLSTAGPAARYDAAVAFVKALHVYVEPLELLDIYGKALNKEVYAIVLELIAKGMNEGMSASDIAGAEGSKLGDIDDDTPSSSAAATKPPTATTAASTGAETTAAPATTTASPTTAASTAADDPPEPELPAASAASPAGTVDTGSFIATGPASTASSQEWEAVSASSAIGHGQPAVPAAVSAPAPAPASGSLAEEDAAAPGPAATTSAAVPHFDAPVLSQSHTAAPQVSEVDVLGEHESSETANESSSDSTAAAAAQELEELEPDAIGEDVDSSAAPTIAATAPTVAEPEQIQPASTNDSWASVPVPRSPSGGNRDAPRWS
ncbi:hypothetical protein V8E36_005435 [Tilletia maclaganii]